VASEGTVREWSDARGFGVLDSADTPGGCWFHFSSVVAEEQASPRPGDRITFTYQTVPQDGFSYRALLVWPPGVRPGTPLPERRNDGPSAAYQSRLTIRWTDGTVTEGLPVREI
jgi:cold shock protein